MVKGTGKSFVEIDGSSLKEVREKRLGMSQKIFASRIHRTVGAVQSIENGRRPRVQLDTFRSMAEVIGISLDEARDLLVPKKRSSNGAEPGERYEVLRTRNYPVFDISIPAGQWADSLPRWESDADEFIPLADDTPRDAFALRIHGDCMEPEYKDGSIIVFAPVRPGEKALQFENGRDYYFEHSDEKSTFKRVYFEPEEERYKLVPINPKYKPFYVPAQMMSRMSLAIKEVRDLKRRG